MTAAPPVAAGTGGPPPGVPHPEQVVGVTVAGQVFGIPVPRVREVLGPRPLTRVPLAAPEVAGLLNLRGRIVTVIDLARRLDMPAPGRPGRAMNVMVEHEGELYGLLVDAVGEVLALPPAGREAPPATLDRRWRRLCDGIHRLADGVLVVLDVPRLIEPEAGRLGRDREAPAPGPAHPSPSPG
ncbi:MAG: chemotaxis protein CheW [Rhodospirillaceae bacterium]|nr:chemotaxis protein CheW [Rhodospirillaceae bacterium]